MVKFQQKLNRNKKIYILKPMGEVGFDETLEIIPNYLSYFEKSFQSEIKCYDERLLGLEKLINLRLLEMEKKLTDHIEGHKHQESLSWTRWQTYVAIISIICTVILSVTSLYYTFNPP